MKRILLFVHYNKNNSLEDYITYMLSEIRNLFEHVVFISNSDLAENDLQKVHHLYDTFMQRKNIGFDFGAWKDAIEHIGIDKLSTYDSVTLMNDTCFGPLYDMQPIFEKMEASDCDFWGITNHRETQHGMPGTDSVVLEHLQSYFLSFKKNIICSEAFISFWNNVEQEKNVLSVIQKYETQMTSLLKKANFTCLSYFDTTHDEHKLFPVPNISIMHLHILDKKIPFLKIKSFPYHNLNYTHYVLSEITKNSKYPISYITNYFSNIYSPNISLYFGNKSIYTNNSNLQITKYKDKNIAVHIHVHHLDIFKKIFLHFEHFKEKIDLFITTNSQKNELDIINFVNSKKDIINYKVIQCINKGRDILPWLNISNELSKYDIVGHFHTKKSTNLEMGHLIGEYWLNELCELLINNFHKVIEAFTENVGLVIPDIPYHFSTIDLKVTSIPLCQKVQKTYHRLGCKKEINFLEIEAPIFPYGNMFWYRPKALKKLLTATWIHDECPSEPLDNDYNTILHAIERLPVYLAWDAGYDYRIVVPQKPHLCGFQHRDMHKLSQKGTSAVDFRKKMYKKNATAEILRDRLKNKK